MPLTQPSGPDLSKRMEGNGAPVDGVTGAGVLDKGGEYVDTTNGMHYYNVGTKAVPAFTLVIT
jgi:hypothetical protein